MRLAPALLEEWMRRYYFDTDVDIGSSGVENFSFGELRERLGISHAQLDAIVLQDSRTLGGDGLRRAIADHLAQGKVERVMVTHGSTDANHMVMTALLAPGDRVLVLDPCYQQLYGIAEAIGCTLARWPLRFERGFHPDLDELEELLTPDLKMVVVNFPHNPTGASLSRDEQRRLLAAVDKVGAYLVWDGAFAQLTYDEPPLPEPVEHPRAIAMGTLSKAYGLPGLRVGWCLAAPEVLARLARVRDYTTLHLSPLVELVAQRVIERAPELLAPRLEQARINRGVVAAWIEGHRGQVDWVPPRGGVSAFIRLPQVPDVDAFCTRLAQQERVLLVPGSCFRHPAHARLGFGCPRSVLEEGLLRLGKALCAPAHQPAAKGAGAPSPSPCEPTPWPGQLRA